MELNYTLYKKDLTDIHRMFHPRAIRYMLFSKAHWTFPKIGKGMTGQKTSLNKLKTEITPTILSDDNGVKLEHESWNTYKYVESKQHTPEQATGQRTKIEKYFFKSWNKWKKKKKMKQRNRKL